MLKLGDCTLDRLDGVGDGRIVRAQHKVGETVTIHEVPAATVCAYVSKRAANETRKKTGRCAEDSIASLLGNGPGPLHLDASIGTMLSEGLSHQPMPELTLPRRITLQDFRYTSFCFFRLLGCKTLFEPNRFGGVRPKKE